MGEEQRWAQLHLSPVKHHPSLAGPPFPACKIRTSPPAYSYSQCCSEDVAKSQARKLALDGMYSECPASLTAAGGDGRSDEMLFKASPSQGPLRHERVSETHGMAASGGWLVSPPSDSAVNPQRIALVLQPTVSCPTGDLLDRESRGCWNLAFVNLRLPGFCPRPYTMCLSRENPSLRVGTPDPGARVSE